jgi:molecular chaperone GrpE
MASEHSNHGDTAPAHPADAPESPPGAAEGDTPVGAPGDADGESPGFTEAELVELAAMAAKADEYLALAQRTQADFENFRKRSSREAALARERGAVKLAKDLLPAVDNLERALAHAPEDAEDFVAGIKHVHTDVLGALKRAGIDVFSPEGEPFDPTLHEAVAQQPIEGAAPGTVVEVFQRGYRIGETVVRPARVVVAG